jgi:tetratricopeptide (TPR) repeat protein
MQRFFTFFLILISNNSFTQNPGITDTVNLARSLAYEKKFDEANNLLTLYTSHHTDANAFRLQALVLFWMKKSDEATAVYEKTLNLFPDVAAVKQDYGSMLYQLNKFSQARQLLKEYLIFDSTHQETIKMLGYIDLWTGHITAAKKKAALLKRLQPGNADADYILQQIADYTAPYIKLQGATYTDDQPLQRQSFEPEAGVYKSWLFSPFIKTSLHNFDADQIYKTSWIEAGNKISLASSKTELEFSAGYFQASNYNGEMSWKAKLVQRISPSFSFDAVTHKKPYQYTLASIKNPFMYQVAELGLGFDRKSRWLGRAAYQHQDFKDGNNAYTAYLWLLAPVIHKNDFSFKTGYAFSYADAKQNTFKPKNSQPIPPVLNTEIEGIYDPYFTPAEQSIHSLLVSLQIPFSKFARFSSNLNIGVAAHASQPSLFVDKNGMGPFFINKKFEPYSYTPVEFSGELQFTLSRNFYINGNYMYQSLIFFKSHTVSIQLKYLFINDKKKK